MARNAKATGFWLSPLVAVLASSLAPAAQAAVPASGPQFAPYQTYATGAAARSVAVADVTGDGRSDVLLATSGSPAISSSAGSSIPRWSRALLPSFEPLHNSHSAAGALPRFSGRGETRRSPSAHSRRRSRDGG